MRNDKWCSSSPSPSSSAVAERPEGRPVFMVNPPIILAFNDDMAEELAAYLRKTAMSNPVPPSVYAFMRQLENDLERAKN
jgi:hypothetical protein